MSGPDEPTAAWLTSTAGLAVVAQATAALDEGADALALSTRLAGQVPDPRRRTAAIDAAVSRRRARARWPEADRMLFTRQALEQASDPAVSAHRARQLLALAAGGQAPSTAGDRWEGTVLDLGAGVGGDAIALARAAAPLGGAVVAVDTDPARLRLLAHNAEVAGVHVRTRCADALTVTSGPGVICHADPGRRVGERRVRRLADHQPSVPALLAAHADALHLAVALSPGVEPEDPDLPPGLEVEYVQLGPALVEATLWTGGSTATARPAGRRATLLDDDGTEVARLPDAELPTSPSTDTGATTRLQALLEVAELPTAELPTAELPTAELPTAELPTAELPTAELPVAEIGDWLLEVAPAAVRARRHDALGARIGAWRVANNRALLTCRAAPPASPWYRAMRVLAVLPGRAKAVRRWLREAGDTHHLDGGVELVLHGVEADPTRLWQELGRPPRGPRGIRLAFIRRDHDTVAVACAAVAQEQRGTMGI